MLDHCRTMNASSPANEGCRHGDVWRQRNNSRSGIGRKCTLVIWPLSSHCRSFRHKVRCDLIIAVFSSNVCIIHFPLHCAPQPDLRRRELSASAGVLITNMALHFWLPRDSALWVPGMWKTVGTVACGRKPFEVLRPLLLLFIRNYERCFRLKLRRTVTALGRLVRSSNPGFDGVTQPTGQDT